MEISRQVNAQQNNFNLTDILYWILKRKGLIISIILVFSTVGYFYTAKTYSPVYRATASMVVNAKQTISITEEQKIVQSAPDIYLAQKLVNTYSIILKSNRVMEYVVSDLKLNIQPEILKSWIQLSPAKDTQVLFVSVTCEDPVLAVNIANSIMKVAPKAMMETVEIGSVNVLDEASLPNRIIPFNATQNIAIAALIGLTFGVLLAFSLGIVFQKIRNSDDIEERLVLQTLGEIPHLRRIYGNNKLLLSEKGISSSFVEAFSRIRTIFQYSNDLKDIKTFIVTSAVECEGKTTVSINIALSLANSGKKVMVIDGDLRKPRLHKKLELTNWSVDKNKNLVNLINGTIETEDCIIRISPNLSIIKGDHEGKIKITDLLASDKLKELLNNLKCQYDYIIVDTPPFCAVSDAAALSNLVDGAVIVIRQDAASVKAVSEVVTDLKKTGVNVLGCILNDIRHVDIGSGYKRKYYYRNKYGCGEDLNSK